TDHDGRERDQDTEGDASRGPVPAPRPSLLGKSPRWVRHDRSRPLQDPEVSARELSDRVGHRPNGPFFSTLLGALATRTILPNRSARNLRRGSTGLTRARPTGV